MYVVVFFKVVNSDVYSNFKSIKLKLSRSSIHSLKYHIAQNGVAKFKMKEFHGFAKKVVLP